MLTRFRCLRSQHVGDVSLPRARSEAAERLADASGLERRRKIIGHLDGAGSGVELAETLEDVLGRPLDLRVWSEPLLMEELAADPDNMTRKYRASFAQGRGVAWDKADTFNARSGISTTTLRQWVTENLRA